ncbi:DNA repair protein RecN [Rubritalea marina]|uniref:DNA repair protein RecN n=1 Tax=Rubritalea marina TaxID=361055 RepID=UPI00037A6517|nr:DNA repair protein RecN [Rubritalea marina]
MLTHLSIKNLALVDQLTWQLGAGLIGVTGETGAGKSVIVGALKLVLGERASKGLIRTGESSCTVEAVFELRDEVAINRSLEDVGIDPCDGKQLIIRRVMGQTSNKQFVNNCPATLSVLKHLGEQLVDLHGPHDHQSLLSVERQLSMLDAYAGAHHERNHYIGAYQQWREKKLELESLQQSEQANEQEMDLLRFQVEEIAAADLRPDEENDIEERYRRASNSARLVENAAQIAGVLGAEVNERLGEVQRLARELESLDPSSVELLGGLDSAIVELQELERGMADYSASMEIDPAEAAALEDRINTFETLKRKYGASLEAVLEHHAQASERLDRIENRGDRIEALRSEVAAAEVKLVQCGNKLGAKRKKFAPKLAKEISKHLVELGFKQASFELDVVPHSQPQSAGLEGVDFQFGPNPGEPLKPLREVASSGEISRVMLAVKSALADQDATPLMVFDEIDANVGGEIARAVGEKMAMLGDRHQVISITHFPQVAAVASEHFVVEKTVEEGRTRSQLRLVDGEMRIEELVRMLGGGDGGLARAMAQSLLS